MKIRSNKLIFVLGAVLLMGIAFAALSTEIVFDAVSRFKNNKWDIRFENVTPFGDLATVNPPVLVEDSNDLNISFDMQLSTPGDKYEFSVDVLNEGTIDAMIESIKIEPADIPNALNYQVTWDNGDTPKKGDLLSKNGGKLKLNVFLGFKKDIDASDLSSVVIEKDMNISIKYEQADESAKEVSQYRSLANDDWATIKRVVSINPSVYKVGDTKNIQLTGDGDLGKEYTVRVANNTTPSECSTDGFSQTACGFVVEFADIITTYNMNSTNTNVGGYPASSMYTYLKNDVYNAIPEEVRNVISDTKVVSGHGSKDSENFISIDKLYLLSPVEVWGTGGEANYDTSTGSSRQLDNYKSMGVTSSSYSGAIKQYNGSNYRWWLRSAASNSDGNFLTVYNNGDWGNYAAASTYGVSPAFRIA